MRSIVLHTILLSLLILPALALPARADNLILASGGGYKAYVMELSQAYTSATGNTLDLIFGNMGRVVAQAHAGGKADMVLGAEWFFKKSSLDTSAAVPLGEGKPALAWSKKTEASGPEDLKAATNARIALPDPKRAIYGRAAAQYLKSSELHDTLRDTLIVTGTVPQVGTYLMSGETDFGFINLTHARKIAGRIGGYAVLKHGYDPIRIVACRTALSGPQKTQPFIDFLGTETAREIARKHGL